MHPDLETLIRYSDDELTDRERAQIERHLVHCQDCRQELDRLRLAALPGEAPEVAPVVEVLSGIREWAAKLRDDGPGPEVLKVWVAAEISPYLGPSVTSRLLKTVAPNGEDLLSVIEPVLALFLGSRAASRLVTNVVDRAIL